MSVFYGLGIALLGLLLAYLVVQDWQLFSGPRRRVTGRVIDHEARSDDGSTFYLAKVRFQTDDGRAIEIVDTFGSASQKPPVGASIDVVYPLDAPHRGRVPHPIARTVVYAFAIGLLGALFGLKFGWLK